MNLWCTAPIDSRADGVRADGVNHFLDHDRGRAPCGGLQTDGSRFGVTAVMDFFHIGWLVGDDPGVSADGIGWNKGKYGAGQGCWIKCWPFRINTNGAS